MTLLSALVKDIAPTMVADSKWTSLESDLRRASKNVLGAKITALGLTHGSLPTTTNAQLAKQLVDHLRTLTKAVVA